MTAPYSGGHAITDLWKESDFCLRIEFTSTYGTDYQHQVYVNRILSGVTTSTSDREILCNFTPSDWPQFISLLAVDPAGANTDYGADLAPRPYNQVKITITPSGWTDGKRIEVTSGTEPGGAVDTDNAIGSLLFDTNRAYDFITEPLTGSGEWNFEIAGVDGTIPDGNRGTAATTSATIDAIPPDLLPQDDGTAFSLATTGGDLVIEFLEYS